MVDQVLGHGAVTPPTVAGLNVVVFFFAFTTIILAKFGQCLKLSRNSAEEIISNNGGILFWEHFKIQITTKWPLAPCFFFESLVLVKILSFNA